MYAREAFAQDRESWRGVILLNVVRCMQRVVETLILVDEHESAEDDQADSDSPPPLSSLITDSHRRKCMRLRASLDISEKAFKARISPSLSSHVPRSRPVTAEHLVDPDVETELTVQAHTWNTMKLDTGGASTSQKMVAARRLSALPAQEDSVVAAAADDDPTDSQNLTTTCRQDMIDLWNDPVVREILAKRKVRWQDWPGLYDTFRYCFSVLLTCKPSFLNDLERVTAEVSLTTLH
jgi:guanine nucleotide-binding protein alpha-1 subunit